jgi:hypothetical protein
MPSPTTSPDCCVCVAATAAEIKQKGFTDTRYHYDNNIKQAPTTMPSRSLQLCIIIDDQQQQQQHQ